MEKELALRLLDAVEKLAVENEVLKAIFKAYPEYPIPWQEQLQALLADPRVASNIHQQLDSLRVEIESATDLQEVIRRLLAALPTTKKVN